MDKETLIHKYIHKELTEQEYELLKQTARDDTSFKEELEIRIAMYADFKTDMKKEMLDTLGIVPKLHAKDVQSNQSKKIRNIIIAIIFSLLTAIVLYFLSNKKETKNEIFATFLEEDFPQPIVTKEDQYSLQDKWSIAKQQFNSGNYPAFLETIEVIELNDEQLFYKGLAQLNTTPQNFKAAVVAFENIPIGKFSEEAKWYLSLALIGNEEFEKAMSQLQNIVSGKSWNHEKAQILLSELKN